MTSQRHAPLTPQSLVEGALRRGGSRIAVVDGDRRTTFATLESRSGRLANALPCWGAAARRPVAALVGNRTEYVEVDVACMRVGVPRVGLSDRLSPDEWQYILEDSEAAVLVVDARYRDQLPPLPQTVKTVVILDGGDHARGICGEGALLVDYEQGLARANATFVPPQIDPAEPSFLMYTSGTTGRPKGAWHSHAARASGTLNMLAFELRATHASGIVHVGPLTHGSGAKLLPFLACGGRNIILDRFDPAALAHAVREEGGTHTFVVPTMIHRLRDEAPATIEAIRTMDQISFGGSPIAPSVFTEALDRFGPLFVQVYGSCEAPHPITLLRPADYAAAPTDDVLTSAGYPSPAVSVRVVDDTGAEVDAGDVGELQVCAPHLMSGYWNNEQATDEVFIADGWYATGDLASIREDGLVTFRDRKRDLIITGGLNVYPTEVERVLLDHPAVDQAVVLGYPDDEWGESVLAYIVPVAAEAVSEGELETWTKERLAGYKKPRAYRFRDELPTGSSHKILRQALRDELWAGRERGVN